MGAWGHAVPLVMAIFSLSHTASAGATKAEKVISWGHELGFGSFEVVSDRNLTIYR